MSLLEFDDVHKSYGDEEVLRGISLEMDRQDVEVVIGPSGSGKSTLLRCVNRLTDIDSGDIRLNGDSIYGRDVDDLRREVGMVFQDINLFAHLTALENVSLGLRRVRGMEKEEAERSARDHLDRVGLADQTDSYPAELSGGQKQRVGIARALAVDPDVIVADEPTSALDVSVQGQLLDLLSTIKRERGLSMVFVSHDLSVIRHVADRVAVMYLGRIVEVGETAALFDAPKHPYTEALLSAVPDPDPRVEYDRIVLEGEIPDPKRPPEGCNFVTRCPKAMDECVRQDPELVDVEGREVACLLHSDATRNGEDGET